MTQGNDGVRIAGAGRQEWIIAGDSEWWVKVNSVKGGLSGVMEWMMKDEKNGCRHNGMDEPGRDAARV